MPRRIGLAALTVLELPPQEQVAAAAEAGYDFVGLRLIPVPGQPFDHPLDVPAIERRLRDTGMKVMDVEVFRLDATTGVAQFEPMLAAAARLGASDLLVHGDDAEGARLADTFGRFCDLAAAHGLTANIEILPWVEVSTVAKANAVLAAAGRPNAAVLPDAIHFFRAANRLDELAASRVRYAQFCDARAGLPATMDEIRRQARQDRLMPGEGALDLRGLLAALPADTPLSLEIPYAKPMLPLERARLALAATRAFLSAQTQAGAR